MGGKLGSNRALLWGAALWLCACTDDPSAPAPPIDDEEQDAGDLDASDDLDAGDAGKADAGDAGKDAGKSDAGDAGKTDAGDAGKTDAGDAGDASGDSGDGATDSAVDGEAGTVDLGPLLEFVELADDVIISGTTLTVMCRVEQNPDGDPIKASSIKAALYAAGSTTAITSQVAISTSDADVFQADLSLGTVPHGAVRVECSAEDTATQKRTSKLSIAAMFDRGPLITFLSPAQGGFVAAGSGTGEDVRVRFKVEPRPLNFAPQASPDAGADAGAADAGSDAGAADAGMDAGSADAGMDAGSADAGLDASSADAGMDASSDAGSDAGALDNDPEADIDDFTVTMNGKPVVGIVASSTEENAYSFGIDFSDTTTFSIIPSTLSIRVDAKNLRTPPATSFATLAVGVDSTGPVITVVTPSGSSEPIVSGKVDIALQVTDPLAGVDTSTVEMVISIPGQTRRYPTTLVGNRFSTTFDVGEYPNSSSLTLNFVASDKVGNSTTSSLGVRIDDRPPWVSLEPGIVRELTLKPDSEPDQCGGPFDPLGDAPGDGDIVQKAVRLRALAWDRARVVSGQRILHYAMVDETSVDIVVQHDTSVPLLINSDGIPGGPCDAVNLTPRDGETPPVVIELDALTSIGTSPPGGYVVPNTSPPVTITNVSEDPVPPSGLCVPRMGAAPPTPIVCRDESMTRIIKHSAIGAASSVVYGINYTPTFCSGDFYSNPTPGPLCMVAQARDKAGNAAFSWPIKLCVEYADGEDSVVTCPDGYKDVLNAITCTDGCVLPTNFGPNAPDRMPRFVPIE